MRVQHEPPARARLGPLEALTSLHRPTALPLRHTRLGPLMRLANFPTFKYALRYLELYLIWIILTLKC